jgi:hypothetical protein
MYSRPGQRILAGPAEQAWIAEGETGNATAGAFKDDVFDLGDQFATQGDHRTAGQLAGSQ